MDEADDIWKYQSVTTGLSGKVLIMVNNVFFHTFPKIIFGSQNILNELCRDRSE